MMAEFALPYCWLGEYVGKEEKEHAFCWAQNLKLSEIYDANYLGYPVGEWVRSSVISYFRQYPPDMKNWRVINAYRGFLLAAAIVIIGLRKYLSENPTDSALLFNGRQSVTRVAFEIFREQGIRVLTHEFPFYQRGHLMVKPNAKCWSLEPFNHFWHMWGKVPLTRSSLDKTLKWLINRRYGTGLSWYAFNAPHIRGAANPTVPRCGQGKRLFALFTSSTDEIAGDPELQGPYESQSQWVMDVVDWVRKRNDVELVIRVHPHLAGKTGLGRAVDEYNLYQNMKDELPGNVTIIMPDDNYNSYALMDEADVGLTYNSTVGIEMAMLGKPVVLASRAFYEVGEHIFTIHDKLHVDSILEKCMISNNRKEIQREAFRLAYYNVFKFELPFPLVQMVDVMNVRKNYNSINELGAGKDNTLDHICNYMINGTALFDSPTEIDLIRTTGEEDVFFEEYWKSSEPLRDIEYEQWIIRTNRLESTGRTIQKYIQKLPLGTGGILEKVGKAIYLPFIRRMGKKI
jgi:hypothetical protein